MANEKGHLSCSSARVTAWNTEPQRPEVCQQRERDDDANIRDGTP